MVLTRILILSLIGSFFTCFANPAETTPKPSGRVAVQSVCAAPDLTAACLNAGDIWTRVRADLRLYHIENPAVESELARLTRSPRALAALLKRAAPYLGYVVDRVESRGFPADVALLPFVESGYVPTATSAMSARGLWQLMPVTARRFGLEENWWFDPRLDIGFSTRAALDYLTYLEGRFDGDWLLALAAYNAGEGRVSRAVAKNREAGRPTDFWHLDLPAETRAYVPRLLAVSRIVHRPDESGVTLPEIADRPYLAKVDIAGAIDLGVAAELAGTSVERVLALNPGLKQSMTSPAGAGHLFLPAAKAARLQRLLARLAGNEDPRLRRLVYTVRSGDSLWAISRRFGVPVRSLAGWNDLMLEDVIRPGHTLEIWT